MMEVARAGLDTILTHVIKNAAEEVKGLGFQRQRLTLRLLREGNAGLVEFQRSQSNTDRTLRFTINLAVVCGLLLEPRQPILEKAGSANAHLRERLGFLLPEHGDKWWEITAATDWNDLSAEVSNLIHTKAAPYVMGYLRTDALIELWKSGSSPGLTAGQRERYLRQLDGIKT
jgi:hypothetical protein